MASKELFFDMNFLITTLILGSTGMRHRSKILNSTRDLEVAHLKGLRNLSNETFCDPLPLEVRRWEWLKNLKIQKRTHLKGLRKTFLMIAYAIRPLKSARLRMV